MDYSSLIYTILAILVAIANVFLIPWLKSKVDAEQLTKFLTYVKLVVQAAEQMFGPGAGVEKKVYVLNALKDLGFKYSDEVVNNAIESAVLELK